MVRPARGEYDNLRVALEWLLSAGRNEDALAAIRRSSASGVAAPRERCAPLAHSWRCAQKTWHRRPAPPGCGRHRFRRRHRAIGPQPDRLSSSTRRVPHEGEAREEVLALGYLSFFARMRGNLSTATRFAEEAVKISSTLADDRARSAALSALRRHPLGAGSTRASGRTLGGGPELRIRLGDPLLVTDAVYNLGMASFQALDHERATAAFADALVQARTLGEVPYVAAAQLMLGGRRESWGTRRAQASARKKRSRCTRSSRTTARALVVSCFSPGLRTRADHSKRRHGSSAPPSPHVVEMIRTNTSGRSWSASSPSSRRRSADQR